MGVGKTLEEKLVSGAVERVDSGCVVFVETVGMIVDVSMLVVFWPTETGVETEVGAVNVVVAETELESVTLTDTPAELVAVGRRDERMSEMELGVALLDAPVPTNVVDVGSTIVGRISVKLRSNPLEEVGEAEPDAVELPVPTNDVVVGSTIVGRIPVKPKSKPPEELVGEAEAEVVASPVPAKVVVVGSATVGKRSVNVRPRSRPEELVAVADAESAAVVVTAVPVPANVVEVGSATVGRRSVKVKPRSKPLELVAVDASDAAVVVARTDESVPVAIAVASVPVAVAVAVADVSVAFAVEVASRSLVTSETTDVKMPTNPPSLELVDVTVGKIAIDVPLSASVAVAVLSVAVAVVSTAASVAVLSVAVAVALSVATVVVSVPDAAVSVAVAAVVVASVVEFAVVASADVVAPIVTGRSRLRDGSKSIPPSLVVVASSAVAVEEELSVPDAVVESAAEDDIVDVGITISEVVPSSDEEVPASVDCVVSRSAVRLLKNCDREKGSLLVVSDDEPETELSGVDKTAALVMVLLVISRLIFWGK